MLRYADYCIIWDSCNGDRSRVRKEDFIKMLEHPTTEWRYDEKKQCIIGRSVNASFDISFFYLNKNKDYWNWMFKEFIKRKKH